MKVKKKTIYTSDEGFNFVFEPIEDTIQVKETESGFELRYLVQDDDPLAPNDSGDDSLFLVGYHRDFTVERDDIIKEGQCYHLYEKKEDMEDYMWDFIKDFRKKYHVFRLEAYIHSGVSLSLSHEGNFPDRRWDVSQLGFVFVKKSVWKEKDKAKKAAESLIDEWNMYLSGDVYGCVIERYDKNKTQIDYDCCFGFYGFEEAKKELETYFG